MPFCTYGGLIWPDETRLSCLAVQMWRLVLIFLPFFLSAHGAAESNVAAAASYSSTALSPTAPDGRTEGGFTLMLPTKTGVHFTNLLQGEAYLTNAVAHNGSGVALGDVDNDGWVDLYFCSLGGPNRLFRNLGGWHFEEVAIGSAACIGQLSTGAAFADIDGDGDLDLLVNGIAAGTRLFLNDGHAKFTEWFDSGLSRSNSATSMALADIDGDGDLDLYCTHYIDEMHLSDPTTKYGLAQRNGKMEVTQVNGESALSGRLKDRFQVSQSGRLRELPEVDGFYRNDGQGHFTAIQNVPGTFLNEKGEVIPPFRDWGLAVMFRDVNGDGAPDLYVCNDNASPSRFWLNMGKGTFRLADPSVIRHTSRSSMGIDFADVDRDGHDDLLVVDMFARDHARRMMQLVKDYPAADARERIEEQPRFNRNSLFLGRADGSFAEVAFMAGLAATDWSWCPIFLDVDLDGYEDLLISTGFSFDVMDRDSHDRLHQMKLSPAQRKRQRQFHPRWPTPMAAFRNRQNGTFETVQWGFDQPAIAYGMALGDLDNDGDLDLVVNNLNENASLYRNDATGPRVAVRLKGMAPNTQGVGARIKLTGGSVTQSQEMICGGRYMSSDQAMRVFAASSTSAPLALEVLWRSGRQSVVTNVLPNRVYEINETGAVHPRVLTAGAGSEALFEDVSPLLKHFHVEDLYDDWARQPLLPRRFSRSGPGLSWFDVNGDGWEDLIIAGANGGKLAVFTNDSGKAFRAFSDVASNLVDQEAVAGWPDGTGRRNFVVAHSSFETAHGQSELAIYTATNGALTRIETIPLGEASPGALALADIDGDGDLDLFIGARVWPGRYPESAPSGIWLNEKGTLRHSREWSEAFVSAGMVSGAVFVDLDDDGRPDLALATEWGPVRIFLNRGNKKFEEATAQWGLAEQKGWWTSITAADFDGDGKLDLAVGNWGRNTEYELYRPNPLRLYYGDWNGKGDGIIALVEAAQNGTSWVPTRNRPWLARGLPGMVEPFATEEAYGKATVQDLLGARFESAKVVEATQLESSLFLNRGGRFERRALPREAQFTPVLSINAADLDGDGMEDLFLSQNFFGRASDVARDDAGCGLVLKGKGDGTFGALDGNLSGIRIDGEQRGAALCDFDHDGRTDLVVSQNNAPTRLYLNKGAKRGVRVRVQDGLGNPDGIGARVRVIYANGEKGPCRPILAGSGWLSEDSATQVLGLRANPRAVWIRWPDGREQTNSLREGQWDITIAHDDGN